MLNWAEYLTPIPLIRRHKIGKQLRLYKKFVTSLYHALQKKVWNLQHTSPCQSGAAGDADKSLGCKTVIGTGETDCIHKMLSTDILPVTDQLARARICIDASPRVWPRRHRSIVLGRAGCSQSNTTQIPMLLPIANKAGKSIEQHDLAEFHSSWRNVLALSHPWS